jgi:acyl-coenzyme A thioesterase PaaI-like protein
VLRAGRTIVVSESEVFAIAHGEERLVAKLMSTLTVFDQRPSG